MNCKVDLHREISSRAFTQTLSRLVQDRVGCIVDVSNVSQIRHSDPVATDNA